MIYLDHHATTPMLPEVWEAMRPFAIEHYGNPSSSHAFGRRARQALDDARERFATLIEARPDEVVFTSGATESNNLAIFGLSGLPPARIVASPLEHPCIVEPLKQLEKRGFAIDFLQVDREGKIAIDALRDHTETKLAIVQLVNHETGAIQPIRELVSSFAGLFHCDAAQAAGKLPLSFRELGVTSLSISAHKFGGPKGIGALVLRQNTKLIPQFFGGHQQQGRRPGTEAAGLAVGMVKALEIATAHREASYVHVSRLRQLLKDGLRKQAAPIAINSPDDGSPYVLDVSFPGCRAELLLMKLDLAGIACSTGSACSSGSLLPSPVLIAMGVSDEVLRSAMRFSFGPATTETMIRDAIAIVADCVARVRATPA